ncbi:unnamed protein product [Pseudo-nitzschia multistriata]|uniref:Protein kinase domain-containing protein n=1 Tax=Pseudo-nitzschia multistriata TaxID=183589 RepID=A0A448YVE4_9STRA|nr:unnamed protein product [Pseudo-nitzschia multistriata]
MDSFRDAKKKESSDDEYCSSSSDYSSSDEESYFSERSSSVSPMHRATREGDGSVFSRLSSSMRHRRANGVMRLKEHGDEYKHEYEYEHDGGYNSSSDASSSKTRRRKRGRGGTTGTSFHWSSRLLAVSLFVWFGVQITTTEYAQQLSLQQIDTDNIHNSQGTHHYRHNIGFDNLHRPIRNDDRKKGPPRPHRPLPKQHKDKEKLKPGCELDPEWQTPNSNSRLLSCQLLHELDISEALSTKSSGRRRHLSPSAHLGNGLWRDVWKIPDGNPNTTNNTSYVVLKTMKLEHDVIDRNLERHRREAATMNRLTSSPYVADLYAYCGNSILTEFASQDLRYALNPSEKHDDHDSRNQQIKRIKEANRERRAQEFRESEHVRSNNNTTEHRKTHGHGNHRKHDRDVSQSLPSSGSQKDSLLSSSKLPLVTRLELALQASKAVAELHQSDVIHADITANQFLVIGTTGASNPIEGDYDGGNDYGIRIKINDFNRCRFVPQQRNNSTATDLVSDGSEGRVLHEGAKKCTIRISSSPGTYRSPEEYSDRELTTQMDVFSLGHVLYEIWTGGQRPWQDVVGGQRIKNMVKDGELPIELKKIENWGSSDKPGTRGTVAATKNQDADDLAFGRIIRDCYWVDPNRRINANGLVRELTKLLDSVREKNGSDKTD